MDDREKLNLLLNTESSATDMLSDFLQARKAILFDVRGEALMPQLSSFGMSIEEVEKTLLDMAAWVHKHRTGVLGGALILDEGDVRTVASAIAIMSRFSGDVAGVTELLDKLHSL